MSDTSDQRSCEYLRISAQFKLGSLVTESSHPVTAHLSEVAKTDIPKALDLLFQVDADVVAKYREFAESGNAVAISNAVIAALQAGGRIFLTGCGSTGRLSIQLVALWRDYWQRQAASGLVDSDLARNMEQRAISIMAGGDFALIKSVEGFEDYAALGKQQMADSAVSAKDVVFAITEGGETSFVIGTVWKAVEAGARIYFVYNNPDEALCSIVERSREVIEDERIEKINLTTGPMAITGSTRMQATTIQFCVLVTILEMAVRGSTGGAGAVSGEFLTHLATLNTELRSGAILSQLARLVALEESIYRGGGRNNYYADRFAMDVLTDTTERSPTYCTPAFRKWDDSNAADSWAFLFRPEADTSIAWERLLKRTPQCIEWKESELENLPGDVGFERWREILRKISRPELHRFRIGLDGLSCRPAKDGDSAIGICSGAEAEQMLLPGGFLRTQLDTARAAGANTGLLCFGDVDESIQKIDSGLAGPGCARPDGLAVCIPVPQTGFRLDGLTHVAVKTVLNALSTCVMVR
ncbi:MAG TPA: hypothetical protein VFD66_12375, partial [Verrucomicrobiae bacterium]|nr:hypothetical protein [Verrucomicrobiae bacterium]